MSSEVTQIVSVALSPAVSAALPPPAPPRDATPVAANPVIQQLAAAAAIISIHSSDKQRSPSVESKKVEDPFAKDEKRAESGIGSEEEDSEDTADAVDEALVQKKKLDVLA